MRRLLAGLVAALLVTYAAGMPEPPDPEPPVIREVAAPSSGAGGGIWYCAWVDAGALSDATLAIGSAVDTTAFISLPSPIANEEPDTAELAIAGPGGSAEDVAEIVRRGAAPGFVEMSNGPAAVSAIVLKDTAMSGDSCVASVSKLWHLPGGTTREGRSTLLRLYNPFPENAKLTISATSEFGNTPLPNLRTFDVPGRSWRDIDLTIEVPFFDDLALTVASEEGLVIPSLIVSGETGEASWPGTGLSAQWEFPIVNPAGMVSTLMITNPGQADVTVEVDVYGSRGATQGADVIVVSPGVPTRLALEDITDRASGVRIRADGPVAAVVVAEDPVAADSSQDESDGEGEGTIARIAGTTGASRPAMTWLVVGPGSIEGATSSLWLLNTSGEPITVTLTPLTTLGRPSPVDKVVVPAGSNLRVPGESSGIVGYLIDATQPISASWSVEAQWGVTLGSGVALDE